MLYQIVVALHLSTGSESGAHVCSMRQVGRAVGRAGCQVGGYVGVGQDGEVGQGWSRRGRRRRRWHGRLAQQRVDLICRICAQTGHDCESAADLFAKHM